jgi:predicted dehydrogenase
VLRALRSGPPGPGEPGEPGGPLEPGAAAEADAAAHPAGLDPASHAAQIADLLRAIEQGREPSVTAASARETLAIVCAVYESARAGRTVVLSP